MNTNDGSSSRAPVLLFIATVLFASALASAQTGVVKSDGIPLPGATVTATQGERKLVTATDENGRYTLDGMTAGAWAVEVDLFGFAPLRKQVTAPGDDGVESRAQSSIDCRSSAHPWAFASSRGHAWPRGESERWNASGQRRFSDCCEHAGRADARRQRAVRRGLRSGGDPGKCGIHGIVPHQWQPESRPADGRYGAGR